MKTDSPFFSEGTVVYSYTRAMALNDGVLIDVSETAREAGVRFPVAVTAGLWRGYIEPDEVSMLQGQSVEGRLWDTLWMFSNAARRFAGSTLNFKVFYVIRGRAPSLRTVKAVCGPGDDHKPVITLMLPDED